MSRNRRIAVAAAIVLIIQFFSRCSTTRQPDDETAGFRSDLAFLARELPRRHKNAFHYTSKAQFEAAVAELNARIPAMNRDEFCVGIIRIAAMIGDSHTRAQFPAEEQRLFPITVRRFGDDYRLVRVGPGLDKALGTRIVKIDGTPAERLAPILSTLVAQNENPTLTPAWINRLLLQATVLHGAGITGRPESATFTLESEDGMTFPMQIGALTPAEFSKLAWIPIVRTTRLNQIAEPMRDAGPTFSFTYIPAARSVYANVRSMVDVARPARQLFAAIRERNPDKVIIDLRANPGGDYFHGLHGLIEPLARLPGINRRGHLFVLIGAFTGSAAVINAAQFHTMTNAILVGEAIGAKPTEYSELKQMTLPYTKMVVGYSVRFYDFAYNKENIVAPDHEATASWEDVKRGIDPALEWCLQ